MENVNVYSQYRIEKGIEIIYQSIIQIDFSNEYLGTVYLRNPGKAEYIGDVIDMFGRYFIDNFGNDKSWFYGKPSVTDKKIIEIFGNKRGYIRVFYLSNVKETDYDSANKTKMRKFLQTPEEIEQNIKLSKSPVYLGWDKMNEDHKLRPLAEKIFNALVDENTYLKKNFNDNQFLHPMSLIRFAKKNKEYNDILKWLSNQNQ